MPSSTDDDATLPGDDHSPLDSHRRDAGGWLAPGSSVGRYIMLQRLGAGGMGVVYAAYDPELDRKVALKLLRPRPGELAGTRDREHEQLKQEAQTLAKLSHPNVVAVHDVGEHEGRVFLAMEFVDGLTVGRWLDQPHHWREVLELLLHAGEGLRAAHEQGLIHRDFKPDNVMVGNDGRVRVMDFGLARSAESIDAAGGPVGTPAYMAPEQVMGVGLDPRTDQFSFCVTLWEGLFGQRPFDGETLTEMLGNIERGRLETMDRAGAVPGWVRKAILRGLEADPAARHPTMAALLEALRDDPTRRHHRFMGLGIVVALVAGGVGWKAWTTARHRAACEAEGRAIEASWTPDDRTAIEQAMLRHPVGFAQETWDLVAPQLDEYADDWQHARETACTAQHVEERWPQNVSTSAIECLEERRAAFEALVQLLSQVDVEQLAQASGTTASLPPLDACLDEAALARRAPPRPDQRDRSLHVRTEVMRAEVEHRGGRLDESEARLDAALAEARALDDAELGALVEAELGRLRLSQGRVADGAELLRRAYFDYGRLGEHEAQVGLAASLARIEAEHQDHADLAESWLDHARMLHEHAAGPDAPEPFMLTRAQATVLAQRGDYEAATDVARRALEQSIERLGPDHPTVDTFASTVAAIETTRGRYDAALQLTRESLDRVRRVRGPHHPEVGRTLVNLALIESRRGELEAALAYAREAVALNTTSVGPEHPTTIAAERELITLLLKRGEHQEAMVGIERVLAIYDRRDPADGIEARTLLGGLLTAYGEHARAVDVLQAALEGLRARDGAEHPDAVGLLINLGAAQRSLGDDDAATLSYREALRVGEATMPPDHPSLAYPLNNLGNVELDRGNLGEARRLLTRALEIRRAKLSPDHPLVASTLDTLAMVELDEGQPEAAIERLEQAHAMLASGADPKRLALVELHLGQALLKAHGDRERALALLAKARDAFAMLTLSSLQAEAEGSIASSSASP